MGFSRQLLLALDRRKAKNEILTIAFSLYETQESIPETDKKSELTSEGLQGSSSNLEVLDSKALKFLA